MASTRPPDGDLLIDPLTIPSDHLVPDHVLTVSYGPRAPMPELLPSLISLGNTQLMIGQSPLAEGVNST